MMKNSNDCKEKSESIDLKESNRTKCSKLLGFLSLFSIAMFLSIGSPYLWSRILRKNFDPTIESDLRYDCFPLRPTLRPNRTNCNTNVCLWDHFASPSEISCYYRMENANDLFRDHLCLIPRYIVSEKIDRFHFKLRMHTPPPFYRNQSNENTNNNNNNNNNNNPSNINAFNDYDGQISSSIPEPYEYLSLSIHHYNREHFSVLIKPEEEDEKLWSRHLDFNYRSFETNDSFESLAKISIRNNSFDLFQLKVRRRSNDAIIFNSGLHSPFIFSNGHIEITILLINDLIYGLGQSNQPFRHNFTYPKSWMLFNQYHSMINGSEETLFGSHPFYLGIDDPNVGNAFGVLLLNTFPIQVVTNSRPSLTLRTSGGHLEFHFFLGPKPDQVIEQLLSFIHKPAMPPYWALGLHLCRSSCSLPDWNQTIAKLLSIPIPIESDCGSSNKITDKASMLKWIINLRRNRIKWLSIERPHLLLDRIETNSLHSDWFDKVLMDLNHKSFRPYIGSINECKEMAKKEQSEANTMRCWFPDFFNPKTAKLFVKTQLSQSKMADGFVFDHNLPTNLANNQNESCRSMLRRYRWNYYYFARMNRNNPCLDVGFFNIANNNNNNNNNSSNNKNKNNTDRIDDADSNGIDSGNKLLQSGNKSIIGPYLSLHNIYPYKMIQTIHFELEKIMYNNNNNNNNDQIRVNKEWQNNERSTSIDKHRGQCQQTKRSFIMSLGTFLGIGRYGGHISSNILNDTSPTLRFALKQMLDFSLFGVSLIGFPVGWQTDSSKKFSLNSMRKWIQFASIQPFMMMLFNGTERIEEIVWSSLKTTIRSALKIRYQLLPYYYTLMFRASKEGRIFLKPLFFQFGSIDQKVYKIDEQFMIGDALMVSPSLESDPTEIEIYFPEGRWYNYYNGRLIWNSRGGFVTQSTVNLNLHLRGGFLIPLQDSYGANTLEKIRIKNGYKFIGGYNHSRMASGELYIDNGIDRFPPMQSLRINIFAHYRNVTITVEQRGDYCSELMNQTSDQRLNTTLEMIKLFGLIDRPQNHSLRLYVGHQRDLDLKNSLEFIRSLDQFFYDSNFGILTIVMDLDFCFNHHFFPIRYYFLNWTYTDW